MKKLLTISIILLGALAVQGQQLPQYTQYMFNQYAVNPAVAGTKPYYDVRANHRYQWVGITDSPRTYTVSLHAPNKAQTMGYGGYIFTDIVGPTRRLGFQLSYAYHFNITDNIKLSLALSGGMLQWLVDGSKITLYNPSDQVISNGLQSAIVPDAKFGFYLYEDDKWYFGGSAPNLLQSKLYFFNYQQNSLSKLEDHYFINGGYKFDIGNDFKIEPSFMVKYVPPAPVKLDVTLRGIYKETVWLGGAFRTNDAWSLLVGYLYRQNLTIGYSYDFTVTDLKNYSAGTHELMLGIRFVRPTRPGESPDAMFGGE